LKKDHHSVGLISIPAGCFPGDVGATKCFLCIAQYNKAADVICAKAKH